MGWWSDAVLFKSQESTRSPPRPQPCAVTLCVFFNFLLGFRLINLKKHIYMIGNSWVFCMAFILADPSAKLWRPLHGGNNWRYRSSRKENIFTSEQCSWTFLTALTISIKQSWSLGWAPRLNNTVKECCILHSLSLYCGTVQMIRLENDD